MVYPSKLCVDFQSDVRQILILPLFLKRFVEQHVDGMDTQHGVANTLTGG